MEIELHRVEGRPFAIRARGNEVIVDEKGAHPHLRHHRVVGAEADERHAASLERVASACKIHSTLKRSPRTDADFEVVV